MKTRTFKLLRAAFLGLILIDSAQSFRSSAESASDPSGLYKLTFLGNSDTIVSVPFSRPAAASGMVSSIADNVVQVRGLPNWTVNQFVYSSGIQSNTYYVRFDSGVKEGQYYPITANGTNSITLNLAGDNLTGVVYDDKFSVVPFWTLATIFSGGHGIFPSPTPGNRPTEVLIPNFSGAGINLSASRIYYHHGGFWKQVGQGAINKNDDFFPPNTYLVVRHNVATNSTLTSLGAVILARLAIPLNALSTNRQDNFVGLARPVPISLDDSGLLLNGAFSSSPLPGNRTDELLTFDNSVVSKNKSASAIYYYWNGAWRRVGAGAAIVGANQVFVPGTGVVIRKGTNSVSPVWLNSATY